ncbi:MAG: ABC transporter [Chloroflexi bacterium RBG_13_66_10]|nr:MAG: ABC transporter [Chloroflexi bacterium RBG_13_66_10]
MDSTAIRMDHLTRDFDGVRAVDHVSLDVPTGRIFGFLGPNAAGKTTTIRLLLGLLEPSSGRAEVLGFDTRIDSGAIRQRCGALLEHTGLYERLTAEDNLEYHARIYRIDAAERRRRIEQLLKGIGLWDRRRENVGKWSRGMKQKLAVARALLHRPELIFLDEPTAGLDPIAAAALREDLMKLASGEGVTVFLTTHNLAEAEKICSLVGVIRRGALLAVGSPAELRNRSGGQTAELVGRGASDALLSDLRRQPGVRGVEHRDGRLRIDLEPGAELAPLVTRAVAAGMQVEEARRGLESLEEAFLALVDEADEEERG